MTKTKLKSKKLAKGVALGFAAMLTTTALPVGAMVALAEDWKGATLTNSTNRIAVGAENVSTSSYVTKGETVTIPQGLYYGKSATAHTIGSAVSGTITKSNVFVSYSATGDNIEVNDGKFIADRVGSYKITYAVVDNGVLYTYELDVVCEASDAEFEFASNSELVVPSVYDVAIANGKDIVLPLPKVNNEDGKEILSSDVSNFTTSVSAPQGKNSFVVVSITNGSDDLQVEEIKDANENVTGFAVKGENITSDLKGKEYTIAYDYYEVKDSKNIFVASTTKTFTVRDGYYRKSSKENAEKGYDLVATLSTKPDSAVVGVEKTLPTISAKTKAENTPSGESVEIYYTLKVYTKDANGAYKTDVTESVITEDGKFKANAEGDYLFEYIAHDFYGNTNEDSKATTTFTITKVKDTKEPDVYMYDAGARTEEEKTAGTYRSAETALKSQTTNRNIVMYAVGGVDNMPTNTLTLRREIWDGSYIKRYVIKEQAYNDYNLIFAPTAGTGTDVYSQIVADNYEIYRQMIVDGKNTEDTATIKTWLKEHNYLLVTNTFNKDVEGNDIVDNMDSRAEGAVQKLLNGEEVDADLKQIAEDAVKNMLNAGYAYIKPVTKDYAFSKNDTYTFYFYANDNINNNKEGQISYSVKLSEDFTDESAPTLTFPTDLQSSYLPNDTITFKTINSSNVADNGVDKYPVVGTAYRYLKNSLSGRVAVASEDTTDTLTYVAKGKTASKDENKYYYANRDANGLFSMEGWHIDNEATSYKIDLSKRPSEAQYVEILAYAIDDFGNIGFYNKVIRIASTDTALPELKVVANAPTGTVYQAPETINLPTLQYSDDRVEGMHARVDLYRITRNEENEETSRQKLATSDMTTYYDTTRGVFTVDAGSFNASSAGEYQVVVTVIDSANHTLSTYFNYNVTGATVVEEPEISNVSTETKELELGKSLYLPAPTLSVSESSEYGYIGLGDEDDSNNATYYFPQVISATSSDYDLDGQYFTGNTKGTYKLQYNVFLLRYSKAEANFAETATDNKLSLDANGKLVFTTGGVNYYVYIAKTDNEFVLHANTQLDGTGEDLADSTRLSQIVKTFALKSKTITISVKDVVIDVTMPNNAYAKTDYPTVGGSIEIVKPEVVVGGSYSVNKKDSLVTITYSSNSSSSETLAKISLEKWEKAIESTNANFTVNGSKISLNLSKNGQYKIAYSIQAQNAYGENVGDPKELSYTIKSGDNTKPTLEVKSGKIATDFALGDTMTIEFTGATAQDIFNLEDNKTGLEELLKTLKVTLKGPSKTETLDNKAEGDNQYKYTCSFEEAGDYTLTFQVTDEAGNLSAPEKISFTVKAKETKPVNVKNVMGGVLIGVSVALLGGVVIYFIVSKVKLDKKERSYKKR